MPKRRRNIQAIAGTAHGRARPGFTLIETAMSLVIIGVGVLAVVDAQTAFIQSNRWSSSAATAVYLANEVREMTRHLSRHDPVTQIWLDGTTLRGWGPDTGELLLTDYDDLDDFDGVRFGEGGDFPGPINAFGEPIYQIDLAGNIVVDANNVPITMRGWSQTVFVEKLHPFNTGAAVADDFAEAPSGTFAGRTVRDYPLRVTVVVEYQPDASAPVEEITRVSWVVP